VDDQEIQRGMGRQKQARSRQQRRQHQRRPLQQTAPPGGVNWTYLLGIGVLAAVLAIAASYVFSQRTLRPSSAGAVASPNTLAAAGAPVDHIQCNSLEQVSYHVHAHLTILDAGKPVTVPAYTGITNSCLYWLHTHDTSGVIHIEAPKKIAPTLGNFFDIWSQPLSRTTAAGARVQPGQRMKVFVNLKPYTGNPRTIRLHAHTIVTIEIGPPFSPPQKFDFGDL